KPAIVGAVGRLNPVAFILRHEVHVHAAAGVGRRFLEELARPADAALVLLRALPSPVHVHHELGVAVGIRGCLGRDATGVPSQQPDEDLRMWRGQLAGVCDEGVDRLAPELGEIVRLPVVARPRRQQRVECALPSGIGLNTDVLAVSLAERAYWLDFFAAYVWVARVEQR